MVRERSEKNQLWNTSWCHLGKGKGEASVARDSGMSLRAREQQRSSLAEKVWAFWGNKVVCFIIIEASEIACSDWQWDHFTRDQGRGRRGNGSVLLKTCLSTRWIVPRVKFFGQSTVFKRKSCREELIGVLFSFVEAGFYSSPGWLGTHPVAWGWSWTHQSHPTSASQVLGIKVWAPTPGKMWDLERLFLVGLSVILRGHLTLGLKNLLIFPLFKLLLWTFFFPLWS